MYILKSDINLIENWSFFYVRKIAEASFPLEKPCWLVLTLIW